MSIDVRIHELIQHTAVTARWNLTPSDTQLLTTRVLAIVSETMISDAELSAVIVNYYADGPRVEALLDRNAAVSDPLWQDIRQFFLALGERIYGLPPDLAEDLAQEALTKAARHLKQFKFRARLETWLTTIWKHAFAEDTRQRQAQKRGGKGREGGAHGKLTSTELSLDALDYEIPESREDYEAVDERLNTQWASQSLEGWLLALLSNEDLLILRLYYIEKTFRVKVGESPRRWTDEAIAHQLGLNPDTITSRRHRALQKLRAQPMIRKLAEELGILD